MGRIPLFYAIENCDTDTSRLNFLLSNAIDLNAQDGQGITIYSLCLQKAIECNKEKAFKVLLSMDVVGGVNFPCNALNTTVLMLACDRGNHHFIDALLDVDAININARDALGNSALMYACVRSNVKTVQRLLLTEGINPFLKSTKGDDAVTFLFIRKPIIHKAYSNK